MKQIPWIILAIIILLLIVGISVMVFSKKKRRKPDYYTFFIMGIIWLAAGIPLEMYPLSAMGLLFTVVGLANKQKWKENHPEWEDLTENEKRNKLILIGISSLLVIAGLIVFFLYSKKAIS